MKLKVCGMKFVENIEQVSGLYPDYMGFIFYEKSKRNFEGVIPKLPKSIKKTGVFVNEYPEILVSLVEEYQLEAIQLHGDETIAYIEQIKTYLPSVEIIKVFGIKDEFNFELLKPFLQVVDYFLFDTKGKERGGNGYQFDWSILDAYPYEKPFFLSGGIGLKEVVDLQKVVDSDLPIYAIDINSKFEITPGLKNINDIKIFKNKL
jgi:phosphoribosylanthranilate isomerase